MLQRDVTCDRLHAAASFEIGGRKTQIIARFIKSASKTNILEFARRGQELLR
jgi:hypothetical protein